MCPVCQMRLAINAECPRCRDTNGPCIYCMFCANLLESGAGYECRLPLVISLAIPLA